MIGHVHTVGHRAVHIGVSATPDQFHAAFDDAVARRLPLRVLSAHRDLHLNELGRIAGLALAYCAVEARWELSASQPRLAVLHLVVPEPAAALPPTQPAEDRVTPASPGERTATPNPGDAANSCDCPVREHWTLVNDDITNPGHLSSRMRWVRRRMPCVHTATPGADVAWTDPRPVAGGEVGALVGTPAGDPRQYRGASAVGVLVEGEDLL